MDSEKKLRQAQVTLLIKDQLLGDKAMAMELMEKKDLNPPTMGTDGKYLYYHPDFVDQHSVPVLMEVIAHEIWHFVFQNVSP